MTTAAVEARTSIADSVQQISLRELHLPDDNVRSSAGDVAELARSIEAVGIIEPIVVMPREKRPYGFLVVCGSRRVTAAAAAGLERVPAIVRQFTEEQRVEAMIVENLQREGLTPLEEANAFQRLVDIGHSQRIIATRVGCSQGHVSKRLALLELPAPAHKALDSGRITLEDAQELGKLRDHPKRQVEALKAMRRPGEAEWVVDRQLHAIASEEKIAKARADHETAGIPILEYVEGKYGARELPKGAKYVREYGYGPDTVQFKPARHKKCPGRAVVIDAMGGVHEVCTQPVLHKGDTETSTSRLSASEQKERDRRKALKEAAAARRAFVGGLLAKPPLKPAEALRLIVDALISEAWQDKRKEACFLLGLDVGAYEAQKESPYRDKWELALLDEASDPRRTAAVGLAVVFGVHENSLGSPNHLWGSHAGYFALLAEHGYAISAAERSELSRKSW